MEPGDALCGQIVDLFFDREMDASIFLKALASVLETERTVFSIARRPQIHCQP